MIITKMSNSAMSKPTIVDGKLPSLFASLHLTSPHLLFRQEQWRPQQWLNQILRQAFGNIWRQDNPSNATVAKRVQADTKCICYTGQDPTDSNADPHPWCHNNHSRFPLLSKVILKDMCICTTRVFIATGSVVTPLHSFLKPHKVKWGFFSYKKRS